MSELPPPTDPSTETIGGGRYRLGAPLGSGGTGTVYRAEDTVTGQIVAVKILSPLTTAAALRHRREVLALRVLQAPGVVRLLDEGGSGQRHFIVMELIDGTPFPGTLPHTWAEIGPTTLALLETLARVHAGGVIHRDLKPENVLVDPSGRPILLDFGLARGDTLGIVITRPDAVVGTPRYQAPEQLTNGVLDPRTDLYALGVMLYEVLAGRNPHPLDSIHALHTARIWRDAPPLLWAAPEVPREVAEVVDRLLARLPEARPRSATEVLLALRGISPDDTRAPFPWLGPDTAIRAALDAIRADRSFDLAGPRGAGRTRCLQEIANALARDGRRAAWTVRGRRPYESLRPFVGDPTTGETRTDAPRPAASEAVDPGEVARQLRSRLRETLAGGTVVLVDDPENIDPWSSELLDAARAEGPVIRAWRVPPGPAHRLAPLAEAALRPLFHGPDRLLHLREDAARALHERTGGLPGRVASEVSAWVGGGLATWRDGRIAVDRTGLDRLDGRASVQVAPAPASDGGDPLKPGLEDLLAWITLAWPHGTPALLHAVAGRQEAWEVDVELAGLVRVDAVHVTPDGRLEPRHAAVALQEWSPDARRRAHAALAAAIPPGAVGRFSHLVGAGAHADAAIEARNLARQLVHDGYVGRAMGVLSQGLWVAREADDQGLERALLHDLAHAALLEHASGAVRYARYEVGRAGWDDGSLAPLDRLLEAALARDSAASDLETRLQGLAPFTDRELEAWRLSMEVQVAFGRGLASADTFIAAQLTTYQASDDAFFHGKALGWMGLLRYRQGRFAEAAELHVRSLALKESIPDRLSALLNAASASLEAQRLPDAARWATEALDLATRRRLSVLEGRALWILRVVAYRTDVARTPDVELCDAAAELGSPNLEAVMLMSEAAIAWRNGVLDVAARLAWRAHGLCPGQVNAPLRTMLEALARSSEQERDAAVWRRLGDEAAASPSYWAAVQTLGLVAAARQVWQAEWTEALERHLAAWKPADPAQRLQVLAQDEVRQYCREAAAIYT